MALRNFWILAGVYPVAAYGAGMTESVFNAHKTVFLCLFDYRQGEIEGTALVLPFRFNPNFSVMRPDDFSGPIEAQSGSLSITGSGARSALEFLE